MFKSGFILYNFQAKVVLDTIVCMFSKYCAKPYEIEMCEVEYHSGEKKTYPELEYRTEVIEASKANTYIGLK
jgi:phenylalanyl-tRNA synthetase beta chain